MAGLAWATGHFTNFSSNPLSTLPTQVPEIQAREIYQQHFLQENDLIVALRTSPPLDAQELTQDLAQLLRDRFPELQHRVRERFPWESDEGLIEMGSLVGLGWANAPPDTLRDLASRLTDGAWVETAIQSALETLATSFSLDPEEALLAFDPLGLSGVPNLPQLTTAPSEGLGFGSEDFRAILIDFPGDRNEANEMADWQAKIEAAVEDWNAASESHPDEILISGYAPYVVDVNTTMQSELIISAAFTLSVVLVLFLVVYRTAYPLLILAIGLAITCLATILLGGFIYGELNAISIGFASILIALVVDYNVIVYQEKVQPSDPSDTFKTAVVLPVIWAAGTTALVFLALKFSAIPGISQLGTLVAAGLVLGAFVSLTYFQHLISRKTFNAPRKMTSLAVPPVWSICGGIFLLLAGLAGLQLRGFPAMDTSPETMLPRYSKSLTDYNHLRKQLGESDVPPIAVLFRAETTESVDEAMQLWEDGVAAIQEVDSLIPHALWPRDNADLEAMHQLANAWPGIREQLSENFDDVAVGYAENAFALWKTVSEGSPVDFREKTEARWVLSQAIRIEPGEFPTAKGLLAVNTGNWTPQLREKLLDLAATDPRTTLLGSDNLGPVLQQLYVHDSKRVVIPSAVVLFVLLFLVFRSVRAVVLSVITVALSCVMLLALMRGLDIAWNQINLMAVPLLLGAGLDYNIHIQLALRRSGGNLDVVGKTTGKALMVCGLSTAAGFASLGWSNHPGMASLGQTCALGILCTTVVALILLPGWWVVLVKEKYAKAS